MKSVRGQLLAPAILVCTIVSGCGTTGDTSRFVVSLDSPKDRQVFWNVRIASAAMDPEGAILNAVNVRPWGKFTLDDLRNIEQSLRDTIMPHIPGAAGAAASRLDVHMMIRRYIVSTSNTGGAVLATVDWAVSDASGKLIYREQFFASDSVHLVGTIGMLKDSVHKAIVRRVASNALALAAGASTPETRTASFEKTYLSFDEAAAPLPKQMLSLGVAPMAAFPDRIVSTVGLLTPSGISTVQWTVAKPSADFDWDGYLQKLYVRQ